MNLVMDWAYSGLPTEPQSLSIRLFRSVFDNVLLEKICGVGGWDGGVGGPEDFIETTEDKSPFSFFGCIFCQGILSGFIYHHALKILVQSLANQHIVQNCTGKG